MNKLILWCGVNKHIQGNEAGLMIKERASMNAGILLREQKSISW